jgi:hypothetical protein
MQAEQSSARFVRLQDSDELVQGPTMAAKIDGRTSGHASNYAIFGDLRKPSLSSNRHLGSANFNRVVSAGSCAPAIHEPRHGSAEAPFIRSAAKPFTRDGVPPLAGRE